MSEYESFEYGTSTTYGAGAAGSLVESIELISESVILIRFNGNVKIDEALGTLDNYAIEFADNPGYTDVAPRRVRPYVGGLPVDFERAIQQQVVTSAIELDTDTHTHGTLYTVTIYNITSADGQAVPTMEQNVRGRLTKVDRALKSLPRHFDTREGSNLRGLSTAMSLEDERIGGSKRELL